MKENHDDMFNEGYDECFKDGTRDMNKEVANGKVSPAFAVGYEAHRAILANGGLVSSDILAEEIGEDCAKYGASPDAIKDSILSLAGDDEDSEDFFNLVKNTYEGN